MPQPGSVASIAPPSDAYLAQKIRELEQGLAEVRTAIPLAMASRNFDGTLDPPAAGTQGWGLTADGNAIFNHLLLRGGIIGNDALSNPIEFGRYGGSTDSANFTVAGGDIHVGTIPVPTGFTQALVVNIANVGDERNAGAGPAPFYARSIINGTGGRQSAVIASTCQEASALSVTTAVMAVVTGLTDGSTVTIRAWGAVDSTAGWTAGAGNAHLDALAIFLR